MNTNLSKATHIAFKAAERGHGRFMPETQDSLGGSEYRWKYPLTLSVRLAI